ncbi:MAG: HNH endonuclease [Caldilineales bacterium]
MHPRDHLILSTAAAAAVYPLLGRSVLLSWAASLLADLDHAPAYVSRQGLASPGAMWRYFRSGEGGEQQHLLHRWPLILAGMAAAPLAPLIAWAALGLAFHRLLDDGHSRLRPAWRRWCWRLSAKGRLHAKIRRRDGYVCRMCGAFGVLQELHHIVPESQGGSNQPDNLISVCKTCHRALHGD